MTEILIITWDGGGNVPPALLIGAELRRRGHGVRMLGHAALAGAAGEARAGTEHEEAAGALAGGADAIGSFLGSREGKAMQREVVRGIFGLLKKSL